MSKNEEILQELKRRLDSGFYPVGSKFPSEYTLADEFAVNKVTINKVVSILCSEGRLQRGMRGAGTHVSAIKAPFLFAFLAPLSSYNNRILKGIQDECDQYNALLFIENSRTVELEHRIDLLCRQGVNGFIGIGRSSFPVNADMPFVWLDCNMIPLPEMQNCLFINSDNAEGGRQLMEAIFERGHREILIYSSERYTQRLDNPVPPRLLGFIECMQKHGIKNPTERIFYGAHNSNDDAIQFLTKILPAFPKTTLIAADSDSAARLLHQASIALNLKIPGNIALTGFGNVASIPIATVEQQPERQGALAVRALVKACIEHQTFDTHLELLDTKLCGLENIPIIR